MNYRNCTLPHKNYVRYKKKNNSNNITLNTVGHAKSFTCILQRKMNHQLQKERKRSEFRPLPRPFRPSTGLRSAYVQREHGTLLLLGKIQIS